MEARVDEADGVTAWTFLPGVVKSENIVSKSVINLTKENKILLLSSDGLTPASDELHVMGKNY